MLSEAYWLLLISKYSINPAESDFWRYFIQIQVGSKDPFSFIYCDINKIKDRLFSIFYKIENNKIATPQIIVFFGSVYKLIFVNLAGYISFVSIQYLHPITSIQYKVFQIITLQQKFPEFLANQHQPMSSGKNPSSSIHKQLIKLKGNNI